MFGKDLNSCVVCRRVRLAVVNRLLLGGWVVSSGVCFSVCFDTGPLSTIVL